MGPPKFFDASLPACHSLRTPADLHILAIDGCFVWASGTLKPWPSATRISKLYQLSGHAVAPTAYRILCVRFTYFVRQLEPPDSAAGATLDTGGWLALARPGLSPSKMRQACLGAITSPLSGAPQTSRAGHGHKRTRTTLAARPLERLVGRPHIATLTRATTNRVLSAVRQHGG